MKKITLLLTVLFLTAFSWQSTAQSTIEITTSGGSFAGEKWVSITTAVDGGGTQIWGQGNGTQCDGSGYLTNEVVNLAPGTYYVNCYDQYDDSWDGTLISVTAYGAVIGDNGGASPNDGADTDVSSACEGTPEELEASFMIVVPSPPACPAPVGMAAAPSSLIDVDLSWSAGGSETNWMYEYGLTGYIQGNAAAILGSGTVPTTPAVSLMGLTSGTSYDYYVQANCGGGNGDSTWSGPFTWTQPNVGDICAVSMPLVMEVDCATATPYALDYATAGDTGFVTSCDTFGVNTGAWFEFTAPASGAFTLSMSLASEHAIFDACGGTELVCAGSGTGTTYSGLTGGALYKLVIWKDGATTGVNNVCLEEVSCLFPTALAATTTDVTADLSWIAGASETMWNYEYGLSGYTQGDAVAILGSGPIATNPTVALSGLTQATTYDYYVQADCGGGSTSVWSGPFTFVTETTPIIPDYLNDFATYPGAGWTEAAGPYGTPSGTSSAWSIDDYGNDAAHANGKCAKVNLWSTTQDEYLISPPFDLSVGTYYLNVDIAFTAFGNTNPGVWDADDYVALLVTQDGTTWTELTRWDSTTAVGINRQAISEITLSGYGATTKFAFYGFSDTDGGPDNDFFVDNFSVTAASLLSIADNVIEGFSIYPNPVNDILKLNALDNIETISVYNLLGQEVLNEKPNALQTEVNMASLTAGVYVVKVKVGTQLGTYKIVKK